MTDAEKLAGLLKDHVRRLELAQTRAARLTVVLQEVVTTDSPTPEQKQKWGRTLALEGSFAGSGLIQAVERALEALELTPRGGVGAGPGLRRRTLNAILAGLQSTLAPEGKDDPFLTERQLRVRLAKVGRAAAGRQARSARQTAEICRLLQAQVAFRSVLGGTIAYAAVARCDPSGPLSGVWFETTVPFTCPPSNWRMVCGPRGALKEKVRVWLGNLGWHVESIQLRMRWPDECRAEARIRMRRQ